MVLLFSAIMLLVSLYLYGTGAVGIEAVLTGTIAMMSSCGPVVALSGLSNNLNQTLASGERVLRILEEDPKVEEVEGEGKLKFEGAALENVSFAYEEEKILDHDSLTIEKGTILGIHGKSGSGKSTILKLLMRFWDVYLKWGQSLDMLKKYPLKPFDINVDTSVKGLSMAYFYQEMPKNFSVFDYISTEMQGSYHYIPDIVYSVIKNRGYAVEDILERIVAESIGKPDVFRAQSTSAIFINEKENFLFPKIGNTYVTHLLKL